MRANDGGTPSLEWPAHRMGEGCTQSNFRRTPSSAVTPQAAQRPHERPIRNANPGIAPLNLAKGQWERAMPANSPIQRFSGAGFPGSSIGR